MTGRCSVGFGSVQATGFVVEQSAAVQLEHATTQRTLGTVALLEQPSFGVRDGFRRRSFERHGTGPRLAHDDRNGVGKIVPVQLIFVARHQGVSDLNLSTSFGRPLLSL